MGDKAKEIVMSVLNKIKYRRTLNKKTTCEKHGKLLVISLIVLGIIIGSTSTFCYFKGSETLKDLNSSGVVVSAHAQATPKALASAPSDVSGEVKTSPTAEEGEFTAYNPDELQTDSNPLIMASGKTVYKGAIACPARFKIGQKIEVYGYGVFTCEDRMNKRYRDGNYFDIVMFSHQDAVNFGRKQLTFSVIN